MIVLGTILLLLPAAAANMAPVFFSRATFLSTPLDLGRHYRNRRVFGDNKKVRGLVVGICAAVLVAWIQVLAAPLFAEYALIDYAAVDPILLGLLLGTGALVGDAIESFFKRQRGIAPGESWMPFDQIDWILGAFVFLTPLYMFSPAVYFAALLIGGLLHPVINIIGYHIGLKRKRL